MMKEHVCYVAADFQAELREAESGARDQSYTLDDGTNVLVGSERFTCTECLFDPYRDYHGKFYREGLQDGLYSAIHKCDIDIRTDLYANIVLSGGPSMLPGLAE